MAASAPWSGAHEKLHPDQGYRRHVGDDHQRDQVQADKGNNAAVDGVERQAQHRLRDKNIDTEGRVKQPDRQIDK